MRQAPDADEYKLAVARTLAHGFSIGDRVELPTLTGDHVDDVVCEVDCELGRLRLGGAGWWSLTGLGLRRKERA